MLPPPPQVVEHTVVYQACSYRVVCAEETKQYQTQQQTLYFIFSLTNCWAGCFG